MKITVEDGSQISEEAIEELEKHTDMIECECPSRLMEILEMVRKFTDYTSECIEKYPEDEATHRWLRSSSMNIDQLLSTTLIQLARLEGFIDENNQIIDRDNTD
jgi:Mg2+ and Co2+ transporter CorA